MIKKIYAAFEAMNQPGIDFLELWNSVEAMGGVTEQNFAQAYKVLNIGAGNSLTVDGIVDSGKHYIEELKKQIEGGIIQKKNDRQKLVDQQQNEKVSLTVETNALAKQIQDLQKQLIDKQQKLAQVDSTYTTPIAAIDQKINVANAALEQVLNQLQGAVDLFSKIKLS
jgi:seryl-tRNA synthetase